MTDEKVHNRRRPSVTAACGFVLFAALVGALPKSAFAIEPWADGNIPVQEGLELWLDASRIAADDSQWPPGGKLQEWRDASGKNRNVRQDAEDARPILAKVGEVAIVRFDGVDDHLRAIDQKSQLESFTVVVVAAPRSNFGNFHALAAFNAKDERDYMSGLTLDLGPSYSPKFSTINVEGRGFSGVQSLRTGQSSFGGLHSIVVASSSETKSLQLLFDGQPEGARPRDGSPISLDEITIGARYYNNGAGPQQVAGFGRSDIAELLVYNRALNSNELDRLQAYIDAKYGDIKDALPPDADGDSEPLQIVDNPPPVQMFLPGFSVRELPIDLTNINNLKYREDGTLVALAYDGKVYLLRDTDGDGLEDTADVFSENKSGLRSPIGMDLTPPGYKHGNGLFVVGKTRCILIVDTDGDERADREIDVASGWKESFHQVDGLGVAFDRRDGSVYFGRGTYNFADPMLKDKDGKPQYSLADESGAIIHVSPDFKKHEIVATGIRFPVGLRINRHGDLFATDQEGATWVPNGNPFDELLHIKKGRHYGFPARHPVHLPNVIDEPSTFDYAPQHQSTCGLNFNEPVRDGGPIFGPEAWRDDVFVAGYSRGKLFRTQLVKTPTGYVARSQFLACLNMLTAEVCIAPDGALVVACHSGGPDWGSGPTGKGKLFKIEYSDPEHPQPIVAWAAGPREVRVEFDRPVDPQLLHNVLEHSKLTAGTYVRAGDRFETLSPGYAAVQAQKMATRHDVPLRSAQLTPDGRTLVFATDPMSKAYHYALELPGMGRPATDSAIDGTLPQHAAIDLDFDLTGCDAVWTPADGGPAWTGWLPHFDLEVSRRLTHGSGPHDALWAAMQKPGELLLRGQLELTDMLRPAVQHGSKIDYEYPPETVIVAFNSSTAKLALHLPRPPGEGRGEGASANGLSNSKAQPTAELTSATAITVPAAANKLVPFELRLTSNGGKPTLTGHWTTNEDDRPRPFPLRRIFIPWADLSGKHAEQATTPARAPELEGGSWARGYKVFFSDPAGCAKCHTIYGRGGDIGPDLSNLIHRDYASVLRDITHPSFAINPDYLSYSIILTDGRTLSGVVQSKNDAIELGDATGVKTRIPNAEVDEMVASSVSTMPEGLTKELGVERMRDLMTFLITPPPQMPRDLPIGRPKPRTLAEVKAVLEGAPQDSGVARPDSANGVAAPQESRPIHIALVAGEKDHGVGEHDYPAWQRAWSELLAAADNVEVSTAWEWPDQETFDNADTIVFYQHGDWNPQRAADVDAFQKRGGGLVYVHWAVDGRQHGRDFANRIGLAAAGAVGFRHGEMTLMFHRDTAHPIIRNFSTLALTDETYWNMVGKLPPKGTLATAVEENAPRPQLWAVEQGDGRVFVCIPGHYSWTFDDPLFRVLLLRGIAWTAHEPVDRFNHLVWPGADVAK